MEFDWWTLGLQAVNFAVLVWLLRRFLYAPVRQVIETRRAEAGAALDRAEAARQQAEAERQGLEDDRAALAAEREAILTRARDAAAAERTALVARARAEADAALRTGREVLAEDRRAALAGAQDDLARLANALAGHILAEAAKGDLLDQVTARLGALPPEEHQRLTADLAAPGAALQVVTAAPLEAGACPLWRDRLGQVFPDGRIDFAEDPAILGGAELRFPHSVLRYTWAAQLAQATEAIGGDGRV